MMQLKKETFGDMICINIENLYQENVKQIKFTEIPHLIKLHDFQFEIAAIANFIYPQIESQSGHYVDFSRRQGSWERYDDLSAEIFRS